jgi:hypothetical protein
MGEPKQTHRLRLNSICVQRTISTCCLRSNDFYLEGASDCHTAPYGAFMKEKSMDYTFLADMHKEFG